MDELHRGTFRPWPGVRWSAVATGALLGAALWLVLLRFADVPQALVRDDGPDLGHRLWWVLTPLLAAGVASWTGVSASGERGIRGAYLHGLLAWAGALLLAALVGPGSGGVLPQPGWSGLAAVVGAVVGAALGRAILAGRVAGPWAHQGRARRSGGRAAATSETRPAPWREVLTGRRDTPEGRPPAKQEGTGDLDHDLH
ncbi:hypothetical protein [Archangium sp.]|jgi:hypothetical protein|uniref:hypothetical protein n=1 Tax=Archangium sp. TaxID=1872627 RepID=UPI002EDA684E